MNNTYHIDLDSTIGGWFANKHFVKRVLADNQNTEVNVRINSLGGNIDDGLDIASQFKEHGNVTAHIFGLTASAATILALGAKKIKMSRHAFVLFHRVSNWVDVWGQMNEEQLEKAIEELQQNKEDNKKIDLVLARMYADKCGKSIDEMHQIMCKGAWLTADEAKEIGFVDEIIDDDTKTTVTNSMVQKFNLMDIPTPPCNVVEDAQQSLVERMAKAVEEKIKNLFNKNNSNPQKTTEMRKIVNLVALVACLGIDGINFDDERKMACLTEDQLKAIDDKINELQTKIDNHVEEKKKADAEIADLKKQIADKDAEIARLGEEPGADDKRTHGDKEDDKTDVVTRSREMYNEISNL